ncbi:MULTISPECIES: NADH-quinone oxidoreductase subunit L [unclassified Mucilaginibacter]|uniref:NADH-quinone oxidoreductase subunit L n=1 Tax=unclassified Mucilaginibacter TaxID=2617802 RepID=UPI002AC93EA3|nr:MULTISPECIES: NADH-quinone oxidoreductase subunit L [unclassified Mucilaginibacter]MEB0248665.1 NADH-quinone oxidoreductase subunit L [Mucilaginibacter sp. 5B2]MEB0262153.1 NADH-quinone oxidoreductase subunit L [Mucilaginibacter sp. 10I4]MEB0279814.1 NADH-quinone oxidoreductase subunit L [Mucilaginibacter sp. 10B2]MEB0301234.1 NADH-quinone oxidoreductase subunit L [Mucilaginibacter sp. 5C4]WPX24214.1 NADH-quinone oxidoreductase subunit L [Mucilaginibacter sp. 5C4]
MDNLIWLIPVLPLAGFVINGLGRNTLSKGIIGAIGSLLVLVAFGLSVATFFQIKNSGVPVEVNLFDWISVGSFHIPFAFLVDQLSSIMLLIITGVGFLIHLYSIGYMQGDNGFGKFFAYLNLFVFFMLLLVMGSNYVVMFIGWEGVGLCSYLLIGFWYTNPSYADAAKKAFVMNRIGDLGFLLGIFLLVNTFGSTNFADIFPKAPGAVAAGAPIVLITLLLFVGAVGKSAQLPLFTWLPDAMAGPTPVSALIHAATMVTAGIYMIARSNILFTLAPDTMEVIAIIGLATAAFAALIALTQTDIKKVLAYSTVSQLGYMFLGLGVGAYTGAFFHVLTHAFFKALLFLGAGSVIHAMGGEQDMRKMGGLKSKIGITFWTMLVGTIAIAGIPPFSGFFSKDEILAAAFANSTTFYVVGVITAGLTSFYMFRMMYLTFWGKFRGTHEQEHHLHESPANMTIPLIVLAILSAVAGMIGVPAVMGGHHELGAYLAPVFEASHKILGEHELSHSTEWILMAVSVGIALAALGYAYSKYVSGAHVPVSDEEERPTLANLSYHKFYIDELYDKIIRKPLDAISVFFYKVVELLGIDGFVNGLGKGTLETSNGLRLLQTGNVGFYIFMMVVGIIAILLYSLIKI